MGAITEMDSQASMRRWFLYGHQKTSRLRLFCFPYAGKGGAQFVRWNLGDDIEVIAVQLPGRDSRAGESLPPRLEDLVSEIVQAMLPLLDRPFAVFGHSMGSIIGYEVTRRLSLQHRLTPERLFVSGRGGAQRSAGKGQLHILPDDQLVDALQKTYGGIPDVVLRNRELLAHFLPTLRADLRLLESHQHRAGAPLSCPITAFGGVDDPMVDESALRAWSRLTTGAFDLQMYSGGHFYLNDPPVEAELLARIRGQLRAPATPSVRHVWMFPGQGAQRRGMGEELFDRFEEQVTIANEVLGFSLRDLCTSEDSRLNQTQFTQPALYVVNALHALAREQELGHGPDLVVGHSLGEYNALLTAGVFDFETGLRLVKRRGELMGAAREGSMAAVVGIDSEKLKVLLDTHDLAELDVANFNTPVQTVLAGPRDALERAAVPVQAASGRLIHLKVSAAFHSRYMKDAARAFADFANTFEFRAPNIGVLSNFTADVYSSDPTQIRDALGRQIDGAVRWYEQISRILHDYPEADLIEVGPGNILTRMLPAIRQAPAKRSLLTPPQLLEATRTEGERPLSTPNNDIEWSEHAIVFLYNGLGAQYYAMGLELYNGDTRFREALQFCATIAEPWLGHRLTDVLYRATDRYKPFDSLPQANLALVAFGVALSETLKAEGIEPDVVVGVGVGELAASITAGAISLKDGLYLAFASGQLIERKTPPASMLAVFASPELLQDDPKLFEGCELAGVGFEQHFVVSGPPAVIETLTSNLRLRSIVSSLLPTRRALFNGKLDGLRSEFDALCQNIQFLPPRCPILSANHSEPRHSMDADGLWRAQRTPADFRQIAEEAGKRGRHHFIDVGATGTLGGYIRYLLGDQVASLSTPVTRFYCPQRITADSLPVSLRRSLDASVLTQRRVAV